MAFSTTRGSSATTLQPAINSRANLCRVGTSNPSLIRQTFRNSLITWTLTVGCFSSMPSATTTLASSFANAYTTTLVSAKTGTVVERFPVYLRSVMAAAILPEQGKVDMPLRGNDGHISPPDTFSKLQNLAGLGFG